MVEAESEYFWKITGLPVLKNGRNKEDFKGFIEMHKYYDNIFHKNIGKKDEE